MLKLFKDLDDLELPWIVTSSGSNGNWKNTISEAVESYEMNTTMNLSGENPRRQFHIEVIAEAETTEELQLLVMLDGYT